MHYLDSEVYRRITDAYGDYACRLSRCDSERMMELLPLIPRDASPSI